MIDLICGTYTAGRSDSSTYDKITVHEHHCRQSTYDLNTPRETYFNPC